MENFKIRCLVSKDDSFTDGEVYSVVDGKIIDDDKISRPINNKKISCIEDIKDYWGDFDWSWIGEFELETEVKAGDKLVLKEDMFMFQKGTEFGVKEVTKDKITISSVFGFGFMSYDELSKFEIIKKKEEWSEWKRDFWHLGYAIYRTRSKEVEFKIYANGKSYRGYSRCMDGDKFDLDKGIQIANKKAQIKILQEELNELTL